jgi:cell division protein ZapA
MRAECKGLTETATESAESTAVTIYGRTYHLRGGGDPDYLERLAEIVDEKMRDVAETTGTADTLKVAILAALNLADERLQEGEAGNPASDEETDKRLGKMVALLDEALAG